MRRNVGWWVLVLQERRKERFVSRPTISRRSARSYWRKGGLSLGWAFMYRKIEDHDVDGVGAFLRQAVATLPSSESVAYLGTDVIETLIQSMDPHLAGGGEPARRWTSDDIVRTLQVARLEPATLRELLSGAFSYLLRGAGLRDGLLTLLDEADVDWLLSDEPDGGRHDRY